jgi:hypothetical protein
MSLEEAYSHLALKWHEMRESVEALRITAVEDQPVTGGVVPAERCADAAEDLLGWVSEGLVAAREAANAIAENAQELNQVRRSLTVSQQGFSRLDDGLAEFNSYDRIAELVKFGRGRRGEWWGWVKSVREAGVQCERPRREVRDALVQCWHELADRSGATSVSVRTTNIGQQIAAGSELKESQRNGLT